MKDHEQAQLDRILAQIRHNRAPGMFRTRGEAVLYAFWAAFGLTMFYLITFGIFSL